MLILNPKQTTIKWVRGALLGIGTFGPRYLGMNTETAEFIIAELVETIPSSYTKHAILNSLEKLRADGLNTRHLVRYFGPDQRAHELYLLREYCALGSVKSLVQRYGKIEEPLVQHIIRDVIISLVYLQEQGIPVNYLALSKIRLEPDGEVKVEYDGGIIPDQNRDPAHHIVPEVILGIDDNQKIDIWLLGILVIEMLAGTNHWLTSGVDEAITGIRKAKGYWNQLALVPEGVLSAMSPQASSFVLSCLKLDPSDRPTTAQLLDHPFLGHGDRIHFFETGLYKKVRGGV